uniref:Uncharacterized protein n=1 Tax=Anguilla anguilla TaxID=7936 RepID=A0A0E9UGU8_ANGAN
MYSTMYSKTCCVLRVRLIFLFLKKRCLGDVP